MDEGEALMVVVFSVELATTMANVPEKNRKSPIVPGKLLPASRILWRSDDRGLLFECQVKGLATIITSD